MKYIINKSNITNKTKHTRLQDLWSSLFKRGMLIIKFEEFEPIWLWKWRHQWASYSNTLLNWSHGLASLYPERQHSKQRQQFNGTCLWTSCFNNQTIVHTTNDNNEQNCQPYLEGYVKYPTLVTFLRSLDWLADWSLHFHFSRWLSHKEICISPKKWRDLITGANSSLGWCTQVWG